MASSGIVCFLLTLCVLVRESSSGKGKLVGGWSETDSSADKIRELSEFAVDEIDAQSNALYKQKIAEIIQAETQVVSGIKYRIRLRLSYTTCKKTAKQVNDQCDEDPEQNSNVCVVEIWEQQWLNHRELLKFNCNAEEKPTKQKRTLKSVDDETYVEDLKQFKNFVRRFQKTYNNEEEMKHRFEIFRQNLKIIHMLKETEQGTAEYGVTEFSDLTKDEFKQRYLGLNPSLARHERQRQAKIPNVQFPPSFDWRDHNAVTPVKNQKQCGSCWAFSVTGNVEGQWAIQKGKLISLSEQELVDCDKLDEGCNGGYMTNAYEQIIKLGGLESESDYPYEAEDEKCHFQKPKVQVTINDYQNISNNETEMAQWLYKNGPISIGINANAMQFYYGGISHPWKFLCNPKNLDHGVLIVGYGSSKYSLFNKTIPYWIVKNSWGSSWGEKGYYRVYRGDGTCGLNLMATSSEVD
uniref:Cystatin n=1 Tax=Hemiscolopendra marginata TaxID=943146 RepID=A0A646QI32_9MYRI